MNSKFVRVLFLLPIFGLQFVQAQVASEEPAKEDSTEVVALSQFIVTDRKSVV